MWESRRDFQRVWEGGKPALWLSMLSTLCHFHGLFFHNCRSENGCCIVIDSGSLPMHSLLPKRNNSAITGTDEGMESLF